jgi:hypothetical protein
MHRSLPRPWYREPWPWLLMAGPVFVIVAGIATIVTAIVTSDGVVADDYYKQGLAINRMIEREANARALGIAGTLQFNEERTAVRAALSSTAPPPAALRLNLVHPTRAGGDQAIALKAIAPGLYEGTLTPPAAGHWTLQLEDAAGTWRTSVAWRAREPQVKFGATTGEVPWRSD